VKLWGHLNYLRWRIFPEISGTRQYLLPNWGSDCLWQYFPGFFDKKGFLKKGGWSTVEVEVGVS
jgi:hypothetical protein